MPKPNLAASVRCRTVHTPQAQTRPFSFAHYLDEPVTQTVQIGHCAVILSVRSPDKIHIVSMRTATKHLGNGEARLAMRELCAAADAAGITLDLWASPLTQRTKLSRLIRFYQSLGFKLTGTIINQAGEPEMIRPSRFASLSAP